MQILFALMSQEKENDLFSSCVVSNIQELYLSQLFPQFKAYFDYAVEARFDLAPTQIHHIANFSHGNLLFISLDVCPEFHDVLKGLQPFWIKPMRFSICKEPKHRQERRRSKWH